MTKLLVSVRNWSESRIALRARVDVVDFKEPRRGPLGVVDPRTARQVSESWEGTVPLSVALGELNDWSLEWQQQYPLERFQYAKIGLSGMAHHDWERKWLAWTESLPTRPEPVAVAYADWQSASAPPPAELISYALEAGCRTFLVDTYDKSRGGLLDHVPPDQLSGWGQQIADRHGTLVVAGGLCVADLPTIVRVGVSMVAVRGGVCEAGRNSPISAGRIRQWRDILQNGS